MRYVKLCGGGAVVVVVVVAGVVVVGAASVVCPPQAVTMTANTSAAFSRRPPACLTRDLSLVPTGVLPECQSNSPMGPARSIASYAGRFRRQ